MPPMAFTGVVTKVGFMQKTATVTVSRFMVHRKTHKRIERSKKFLTHDPENSLKMGDTVLIRNCPPVSARKRFRLEKIIKSPETEWEQANGNEKAGVQGEGESTRIHGGILEELRVKENSTSKMAQAGTPEVMSNKSETVAAQP